MVKTKVEKKAVYQDVIVSEECRCDRCGRHLWFHTKGRTHEAGTQEYCILLSYRYWPS